MASSMRVHLLLVINILFSEYASCNLHKRATGGLPQILEDVLLSSSSENITTSSSIVSALETQTQQLSKMVASLEQSIVSLRETQNPLLSKMVASLDTLTKGMHLTAGDCSDIAAQGPFVSGTYTITPWDDSGHQGSFRVFCDMETDEGGWTVVQKRFDGSTDFYRGWDEYRDGFGDVNGEYWLGLSKLNRLTNTALSWQLRIDLVDFDNATAYAQYNNFRVGDETTSFQLSVGSYTGTAGDELATHADMPFSTKDADNDRYGGNCATSRKGGWWYNSCGNANLNGLYYGSARSSALGMHWYKWKTAYTVLKRSEMKIRPVQ